MTWAAILQLLLPILFDWLLKLLREESAKLGDVPADPKAAVRKLFGAARARVPVRHGFRRLAIGATERIALRHAPSFEAAIKAKRGLAFGSDDVRDLAKLVA